jgi:hypothetical protein
MDESQQDTICKLKFLGRIGKGEKINVKELTLQTEGWVTAVKRTVWTVDNRNNTMSFIQTIIQGGFNLITSLNKSDSLGNKQLAQSMVIDINKARNGIANLKTTYSDDTFFCCGIDTYMETIVARLSELKTKHVDLFAVSDDVDNNDD